MGKLIIGIIAIASVHLGFIAFMANDRAVESARLVVGHAYQSDLTTGLVVTPASMSVYDEPRAAEAEMIVPERKVFVPVYIVRHVEVAARPQVIRLKTDHRIKTATPRQAERITFATRIIKPRPRINKERTEADQRDLIYELATMKERRLEKRSFVASSVVPVVKKPWELIKAVGDKLR